MINPALQQKWLETPIGQICYFQNSEFAGRPTAVLLHGLSSNHTTWLTAMRALKEIGLNSLALDLRGHGHSDKTKKKSLYKFSAFTEDLKQIIETEKLSKIILVGYSFGGFIALDYVIKYPQSVTALILISANHVNPFRYKKINFLTPLCRGGLNLLAWLLLWQKRKNYYYFDQESAQGYWQSTFKGYTTMPLAINFWMLAEVANLDFRQAISQIACPTLIIKSQADPFLSAEEARDMIAKIKNSKLIVAEEDTHFLASRFQEKIIKVIIEFLKEKSLL
ncbi:alpha/beta hydrolase [Patescibacteria group bacterium]|nr:alpha/beta hydrolase [Patescibacteria group bacterium]